MTWLQLLCLMLRCGSKIGVQLKYQYQMKIITCQNSVTTFYVCRTISCSDVPYVDLTTSNPVHSRHAPYIRNSIMLIWHPMPKHLPSSLLSPMTQGSYWLSVILVIGLGWGSDWAETLPIFGIIYHGFIWLQTSTPISSIVMPWSDPMRSCPTPGRFV